MNQHERPPRVVLLDDDPDDRLLVTRELDRTVPGVVVVEVADRDGFERVLAEGDYDLVITDYQIRWTDGLQVLRRVHAQEPLCPVIMFTGTGNEEVAVEAMKTGLHDYIVKSTKHLPRLAGAVHSALDYARARRDLVAVEARQRGLLERLNVGVFRATLDGELLEGNAALADLLGLEPGAMRRGLPLLRHLDADGAGGLAGHLQRQEEARDLEVRFQRPDGSSCVAALSLTYARDGQGRLVVDGLVEDVRARREAEELRIRLVRADRLAAMGRLAAGVAHEVNNPGTVVLGSLQVARRHVGELREVLDRVRPQRTLRGEERTTWGRVEALLCDSEVVLGDALAAMRRISTVTKDLLSFGRVEQERVERVALEDVLESACRMVRNEVRHRAELVTDFEDVPAIAADPDKLVQVFTNLLINAAQAIPEGEAERNQLRVATRQEGQQIVVTVEDTGPGIPPDLRARIFEPFFTTKARDAGTGLGLWIAAEIVRKHGGEIRLDPTVERGTRFEVVLPVDTGLVPNAPPAPAVVGAPGRSSGRRGRVLVVEDQVPVLTVIERMLAPRHDVVTAEGGAQALRVLARDQGFDLVLCDLMMPEVDGPRLYEAMRERAPHLLPRFVFLSGGAFTDRVREFISSVPNPVLPKPVEVEDLQRLVDRMVARAQAAA